MRGTPLALRGLVALFAFGTLASAGAAFTLLFPGTIADGLWRYNPEGRAGLTNLGTGGIALMVVVSVACAAAARGLWLGAAWGRKLAIAILLVSLAGDLANAVLRGDLRTLIGVPIAGALIAWLMSPGVRAGFSRAGLPK